MQLPFVTCRRTTTILSIRMPVAQEQCEIATLVTVDPAKCDGARASVSFVVP
jgi:hypothetical protein